VIAMIAATLALNIKPTAKEAAPPSARVQPAGA
jgi:hypothetical protein